MATRAEVVSAGRGVRPASVERPLDLTLEIESLPSAVEENLDYQIRLKLCPSPPFQYSFIVGWGLPCFTTITRRSASPGLFRASSLCNFKFIIYC